MGTIPPRFRQMFPALRPMQQICMNDLLGTDQNVVISAPTSSGKTLLMELAMVRAIDRNQGGQKPTVVYICPLKSLTSDKLNDWRAKGQKCGFTVNQLTGDSDGVNEFGILKNSDVLCCTTEKFDWLTRRYGSLLSDMRLLLIDEVHGINDRSRGATLEAFLTRVNLYRIQKSSGLRIMAVSATIPNVGDLKEWLGPNCKHFQFGDEYRPVPLYKLILPYQDSYNAFQFDKMLTGKIPEILQKYSDGKPALVFCMCRKATEESAVFLKQSLPLLTDRDLEDASKSLQDRTLCSIIRNGVAFHHAGLSFADKKIVEDLFKAQKIKALFSTTTLAQGVDLPAHLVVIKGTRFCIGKDGAPVELAKSTNDLLQMIGRAGRPSFDSFGGAVVLATYTMKERYEEVFKGGNDIESGLFRRLPETINAEVSLSGVSSMKAAVDWLKQSFLYVRLAKNLPYYLEQSQDDETPSSSPSESSFQCSFAGSIDSSMINSQESATSSSGPSSQLVQISGSSVTSEEFLLNSVTSAICQLNELELITYQPSTLPEIRATALGKKMARHCVALKTMKLMLDHSADETVSLYMVFDMLAKSEELSSEVLRKEEESQLDSYRDLSRFQLEPELDARQAKVYVLMQVILSNNPIVERTLADDARRLFRTGVRLAHCFLDIVEVRKERLLKALHTACLFCKILTAELWHDSEFVSKQLPGIGPAYSRSLAQAGFTTFEKLASANEIVIQNACSRNPPFGFEVKNNALHVPRYSIEIAQLAPVGSSSAHLTLTIRLVNVDRLKNRSIPGLNHKSVIFVGDNNKVLRMWRVTDPEFFNQNGVWVGDFWTNAKVVSVFLISLEMVGVDVECQFEPAFLGGGPPASTSTPVKKVSGDTTLSARKRELNTSLSSQYESDDDDELMAKLSKCSNLDLDGELPATTAGPGCDKDAYESEDDDAVLEKLAKLENESSSTQGSSQMSSQVLQLQLSSQEFDSEDDESVLAKLQEITDEEGNNL